jgi:hypothetical protein
MTAEETINDVAARLGITMRSEFVPWSLSRSAGEKGPSLNWKVTLYKSRPRPTYNHEKEAPIMATEQYPILTTDYKAGIGHAPSYKQFKMTADERSAVVWECENGRKARHLANIDQFKGNGPILEPKFADVLYSLVTDSEAIDYGSFEEWANMLGDDPDSRKAETMYRACLEIGLKLRNALGDDGLRQLREACQDY